MLGAFMLTLDPSAFQCINQIVAARLLDGVAVCGLTVQFIAPNSLIDLRTGAFTIHSVDRVQNLSLWKTYAAKRAATCSREDDPEKARRRFVRAWLFHGSSSNLAPKILQQGFNRSFCGKHNTLYGKGVYFARDASYSTYPLYCTPDAKDVQTVFLVRVVATCAQINQCVGRH